MWAFSSGELRHALATSDPHQQRRVKAELELQHQLFTVRVLAANVMTAVIDAIGTASPSYVGDIWSAAATHPFGPPAPRRRHKLLPVWESLRTMVTRQDITQMRVDIDAAQQRGVLRRGVGCMALSSSHPCVPSA